MNLGENILRLRKKSGLSQEELGEKVNVTRQTISNWELGETSPNPEQLKLLSKALNISIDELLDNDVRGELIKKVSNTEILAGIIIKILKVGCFLFCVFALIDILILVGLGLYTITKPNNSNVESSATTICYIDDETYEIEFGTNNYFRCDNCTDEMKNKIKEIANFNNMSKSFEEINNYFISKNGTCE